ncbi:DUF6358 family protein [Pedobacter frigoris]|uniref:DUF6358 family protein n=1 Tax=Pedobacter frigoris TaxID=2571272 RepID=UPI00292D502D|nr:DUF6358 family protein [Pedobacter frigoris]
MGKKIALNIFYNLGIIVSIYGSVWAYNNANYPVIALFVATAAFFVYQKIQLTREVRNSLKKK